MAQTTTDERVYDQNVRQNIKLLKRLNGVTDAQIGEAIGMSGESFRHRLVGRIHIRAGEAADIADYFGVPLDLLFGDPKKLLGKLSDLGFTPSGWMEELAVA